MLRLGQARQSGTKRRLGHLERTRRLIDAVLAHDNFALDPLAEGGRLRPEGGGSRPLLQWAGNLGRVIGADAEYSRGVPEPTYFVRSLAGRDSMILTAEAYVPGLTDHPSADLSGIVAEVVTDLGSPDRKPRAVRLAAPYEGRRVNNNLRVSWNVAPLVASATPGEYHYQFRFTVGAATACVPAEVRRLIVADDVNDVPADALVQSSLLFKVGEVNAARIGWLGAATVRTTREQEPKPLPAELDCSPSMARASDFFLELAVQVWAPGVSNRADLTPEEHTLALAQLGVRVESPFFSDTHDQTLGFAGKAGIHEHDDIARFNLGQYLTGLASSGAPLPPAGDYPFEVWAGDKSLGILILHWNQG